MEKLLPLSIGTMLQEIDQDNRNRLQKKILEGKLLEGTAVLIDKAKSIVNEYGQIEEDYVSIGPGRGIIGCHEEQVTFGLTPEVKGSFFSKDATFRIKENVVGGLFVRDKGYLIEGKWEMENSSIKTDDGFFPIFTLNHSEIAQNWKKDKLTSDEITLASNLLYFIERSLSERKKAENTTKCC